MSEPRAIDIVAAAGMFDMNLDILRYLEERVDAWVLEQRYPDNEPLLVEIRRLISEQICGLELRDDFLVVGPHNKVFRVTKERI